MPDSNVLAALSLLGLLSLIMLSPVAYSAILAPRAGSSVQRRGLFVFVAVLGCYGALFFVSLVLWLFEFLDFRVVTQLVYDRPEIVRPMLPFFVFVQTWGKFITIAGWLTFVYFFIRFLWRRWPRIGSALSQ